MFGPFFHSVGVGQGGKFFCGVVVTYVTSMTVTNYTSRRDFSSSHSRLLTFSTSAMDLSAAFSGIPAPAQDF